MKQQLEQAIEVSDDVAAGGLPVAGHPDLIGDPVPGELVFVPADVGNFRDGIDAVGEQLGSAPGGHVEGVADRQAALHHGHRGQAWKPHHVPDGIDVRHPGLVVPVDLDAPSIVGLEAGRFQIEGAGVALPPHGIEESVRSDLLAAGEHGRHQPLLGLAHAFHGLAEAERYFHVAHAVTQRFDDLRVHELQHAVPRLHQGGGDSQGSRHAGVFGANHAGSHNGNGLGEHRDAQQHVGVQDGGSVQRDLVGAGR